MTNEELAGWNLEDGPAPEEHGTPVEPIAFADTPEALPKEDV